MASEAALLEVGLVSAETMEQAFDVPVTLAALVDRDALLSACLRLSRIYRAGIALFDSAGKVLLDTYQADIDSTRPRDCCQVNAYRPEQLPDGLGEQTTRHCRCGARYQVLALQQERILLGRLVFGPYWASSTGDSSQRVQSTAFRAQMSDEEATEAAQAIVDIVSVILQTGYARHLTSQIHVAAIQDAYNELQEKNRRLADSLDRLKQADRVKTSFLATVSHELRTPLTSVIGYTEMLLEGLAGDLSTEQEKYVATIKEKSDQLLQIIAGILDISKIESGGIQLHYEEFDLGDLAVQVNDALLPQARRKRITLDCSVPDSACVVLADKIKIRQSLLNLYSNAIKFTPDGGRVWSVVCAAADDGARSDNGQPSVEVSVHDTGVGISPEERTKVFEAFYQVDDSATRRFGGTGLGLAIVRQFVQAHGGRVWVDGHPEAGQPGSVFRLSLPKRPPDKRGGTHPRGQDGR